MTSWCTAAETGAGVFSSASVSLAIRRSFAYRLRAEARLVVRLEDSLAVHLEHAARGESSEQRLAHERRVHAALRASANASLTAASVPPITIWLQTLQVCPAPDSPIRTTRSGFPIASRIGFTAANASASPPTMIDSVA